MTIKPVYGYHQPTANKKVKLIKETVHGDYYLILAQDDRSICLEVDNTLYRVFREDQQKGFECMDQGLIPKMVQDSCKTTYVNFLNNKDQKCFANAVFFAMINQMGHYKQIEDNNLRLENILKQKDNERKEEDQRQVAIEEKRELIKFNLSHPRLNEYKEYLLKSGLTARKVGSDYKTLQRLTNIRGIVSSRACWLVNNIDNITVDSEKMRFYLDEGLTQFIDIDTKAQLNFALWLKA